jgi:crotonobetainyl-CoA:carnitine CoA-transferase CaiB-like acyl-CoA transferase
MALYHRQASGAGQHIDISMTDGMLGLLPTVQFFQALFGTEQHRGDGFLSHRYACYNTYRTADDRYLSVGAVENHFWQNLCRRLGKPEYGPLQYDEASREEIIAFMREKFRKKSLDDWVGEFEGIDVCVAPIRTVAEAMQDPLFNARDMVTHRNQPTPALGVPVKLSQTPGAVRTAPPSFGENTEEILGKLGFDEAEIRALREKGVV